MEKENKVLERLFSDIAIGIRKGEIGNSSQVREKLLKEYIPDDTFRLSFSEKDIKTIKVATYILKKIEESLDPLQEKISTKITLEHILPRNPDKAWINYLRRNNMEKDEWVYRIGNLTLLLGKVNKKALNSFFTIKRDEFYKKMTRLKINEDLKSIKNWTDVEINERQNRLAEQAVKVWKI